MKKQFLTLALVVVLGIGGAFATIHTPVEQKPVSVYTYYEEGLCDTEITCSEQFAGVLCAEYYQNTTLYDQPGCDVQHTVAIPQGRRPL